MLLLIMLFKSSYWNVDNTFNNIFTINSHVLIVLGDFALLLKKGVTAKKAILFNCLSSVLSCIGMVIGIAVGNIGAISLWIFLAIAGMFIYISLVDMVSMKSSYKTA